MAILKAVRHLIILALIVLAGCMSSSPSKTSAVMQELSRATPRPALAHLRAEQSESAHIGESPLLIR